MKNERALELLNNIVDYVSVANDTTSTIEELMKYGFEAEELVNDFNFSKSDVEDVTGEIVEEAEERPYKLHARVTKEISVTKDQLERLCNHYCGCVEHAETDDIIKTFLDGVNPGNYEAGYIPFEWIEADILSSNDSDIVDYFKNNCCNHKSLNL